MRIYSLGPEGKDTGGLTSSELNKKGGSFSPTVVVAYPPIKYKP